MDNYAIMQNAAKKRFCRYDMGKIAEKPGVSAAKQYISTTFLNEPVLVDKTTGEMTVGGKKAGFAEALTVFDWLCDRSPEAAASYEFCPVTALTRAYTSGDGLNMGNHSLAAVIEQAPEAFRCACEKLGGREVALGDIGFQLNAFPDLPVQLKFYFSDEEFPPVLTLLWDKNTLQFIRYETVYYLAGCLLHRLEVLLTQ